MLKDINAVNFIVIGLCLLGMLLAGLLVKGIKKTKPANERMEEIAGYIKNGSIAYLKRQYIVLSVFLTVMFLILGFIPSLGWGLAFAFLFGAALSVLAGYLGMRTAVISNVRTTSAAQSGLGKAFKIAFSGGAVMGILVVSL